jgi:hypothetical protein
MRTGKLLGPGLKKLQNIQSLKVEDVAKGIKSEAVGAVLDGLNEILQNTDTENAVQYITDCICMVRRNGEEIQPALIDSYYQDDIMEMFSVVRMVFEVNLKSFLPK